MHSCLLQGKKKWLPQWAAVNDRNERKKEEKRIA
jgi:hypothetical protein